MSESQERMCAVIEPHQLDAFMAICTKWDVIATVIGEVNQTGRLTVEWHGDEIVDVPPRTVAHEGPIYERPYARPTWQDALQADGADRLARPSSDDELRATVLRMVAAPNLASKAWVTDQYDRYVLGGTVMAQPDDSGMVRLDDSTTRGVAVSTDCNGRFAKLDPYAGAQLAFSEAFRNVAVTGATPIAVTNCLNFGSPEDPDVMWQFSQAVGGLADACLEMGTPVTGGNVSFYNQTGEVAILPTPVVGVLGVIDDVASRVRSAFVADDDVVMLLGTTRVELNGSEWAHEIHGHLGGLPPVVDLKAERALASFMADAVAQSLLSAAHDVSDGGVAQTLVEMAIQGNRGVSVDLGSSTDDRFVALYSESVARAVVTMPPQQADAVIALATQHGVPVEPIGRVTGTSIDIQGGFTLPLDKVRAAHLATLPALFDHTND